MNEMERLQVIMQKEELNARDFAAEVGISAATMSNILNMKNKPSLEVMQKVLGRFRMVSPEWLILGVGTMYKLKPEATEQALFDIKPELPHQETITTVPTTSAPIPAEQPITTASGKAKQTIQIIERPVPVEKKVSRIVVFFEDGTFQELCK